MFSLNEADEAQFRKLAGAVISHEDYGLLKGFMAHGNTSIYEHSMNVARLSFRLGKGRKIDREALVRGALLHDFYLYDWHDARTDVPLLKMHGFTHPFTAAEEAGRRFKLSEKERNIIESHMWPLTFFTLPRSREAWIVSLADKIAATGEIFRK